MLISKVEGAMHMDRSQQTVMRMISEQERAASVRELSAIVIQKVWRAYHPGKNGHASARGEKKAFEAMEEVTCRPDAVFIFVCSGCFHRRAWLSVTPDCVNRGVRRHSASSRAFARLHWNSMRTLRPGWSNKCGTCRNRSLN